jgi:glycosyltransferase involved in cell wall biosynthesis
MQPEGPSKPPTDRGSGDDLRRLEDECDRLRRQNARLREERNGYYGEWQHSKNQLAEIQTSKMWKLWMASIELRRSAGRPLAVARLSGRLAWSVLGFVGSLVWAVPAFAVKASSAVLDLVMRGVGWMYLVAWTFGAGIAARLRPHRSVGPTEGVDERGPTPADHRRLRVLLVSPYHIHPADHGGGVRLFNLVRELGDRCDLHLLVFSQRGEDPAQRAALEPFCARVDFHHWRPRLNPDRLRLLPPNAQLFASDRANAKIRDIVLGHDIDLVQLEYTELAQYHAAVPRGVPVILTEHDVAFRSFRRRRALGFHHRFPEGSAFGTSGADARRLQRYEILSCREVDQIHTMSVDDAEYLARFLPDGADRIVVAPNGVDTEFYREPVPPPTRSDVLYVGNYQNLPNVDALEYFVLDVWPLLRLDRPDARLSVVGANPSDRVLRFDGVDGITVVGPVDDLRDAYHSHRVMVAPIRAGSGTRLKILEAFAAGIPVVSTTLAAEGIRAEHGTHLLIADNAVDFAGAVATVLADDELARALPAAAVELVRGVYDWRLVADRMLAAYRSLVPPATPATDPGEPRTRNHAGGGRRSAMTSSTDVSVVIPTLNGGDDLRRTLEAVRDQRTDRRFEIVCVDSGSTVDDLATMERLGARVVGIDRARFNHGLTRDLGARLSAGNTFVFLNQDAVPAGETWLEELVGPFDDGDERLAAVQGGMAEVADPDQRFYWDSCGERFYFTSESRHWIADHGGMGFSTVNCAISRAIWQRFPFGHAPIMEDKKWQREVTEAGYEIRMQPEALVHHTHNYTTGELLRRCSSEGTGWRALGEPYTFGAMAGDMFDGRTLRDLARGLRHRRIRNAGELFFPWLRPMALYWGNHFARGVKL